jgi:hypothetical protein
LFSSVGGGLDIHADIYSFDCRYAYVYGNIIAYIYSHEHVYTHSHCVTTTTRCPIITTHCIDGRSILRGQRRGIIPSIAETSLALETFFGRPTGSGS